MNNILHYTAYSTIGLVRKNNEDAVYAGPRLLALADGMGGHVGGEIASRSVITSLEQLDADEPSTQSLSQLHQAVLEANSQLAELIEEYPELEGMGTTLTAILFTHTQIALCHIGDSRAYLYRDSLTRLTKDDTLIQLLIDSQQLSATESHLHPQKSILIKALTGEAAEPTLSLIDLQLNDKLLLCSDGLTDVVSDEMIAQTLAQDDINSNATTLIEAALQAGGPDNISLIVAEVQEGILPLDQPILAGSLIEDNSPAFINTKPLLFSLKPWYASRFIHFCSTAIVLILLFASAIMFIFWKNNYFLGNEQGNLVIYQGIDNKINFLHHKVLNICLSNNSADLSEIEFRRTSQGTCRYLNITDIGSSQRQSIRDLPKSNSLVEVKDQVRLLLLNNHKRTCHPSHRGKLTRDSASDYCPVPASKMP